MDIIIMMNDDNGHITMNDIILQAIGNRIYTFIQ
jgi:hypothetical protein